MLSYFKRAEHIEQDPLSDIRKEVAETIVHSVRQDQEPLRYEAFRDYETLVTKEQFPKLRKCAQNVLKRSGVKKALANCKEKTEAIAQDEASKLREEVANCLGVEELIDPPIEPGETRRTSLTENRWEEPFIEIHATNATAIADVGAKTVLHGMRLALQECTQAARYSYDQIAA